MPWRILFPAVLGPNLFYAIGRGAVVPLVPVLAVHMGAGLALAAFISALLTVGELSTVLAASWLVVRIGERLTMVVGSVVAILGAGLSMAAGGLAILGTGAFLIGAASSVYVMARQAWVAVTVPGHQRARAYALVAGSQRVGMLIGPLIAAVLISLTNNARLTFLITIVASLGVVVILYVWPTPSEPHVEALPRGEGPGVLRTLVMHRKVLTTLGVASALLASMRAVRLILIPLWGSHLGLDAVQISLVVGVSSAIDVAFFYAGGQITDRFGRMWISVPTMLGFALANIGLALSDGLPAEVQIYVAMAVFMSLSNALSSGVNATMGADLADPRQPALFLGPWRLVNQVGSTVVPLLFAATTALSLALATLSMGVLGLVGAAAMWRYIPRYLPHHTRANRPKPPDPPPEITDPSES